MNTDMSKETESTREPISTTVIVPLKKMGLKQSIDDKSLPERGHWSGKLDFIMGCISYAVGLGNVWRFPYLCYENGGGAFLFPYVICLIICAIPLFFMEVALGQYLNCGGIGVWNLVPMFKGVGFASMTIVCFCNIYYAVIIAWTLFYLVSSFTSDLPWKGCNQPWNSENCLDPEFENITGKNLSFNDSSSPIQEFWEKRVLGITSGIEEMGDVRMELSLYLLLAWALVYLVVWKGLHNSGKVIWFTAIFPYVILTVLFCRGVTLKGALSGLQFYFTPKFEKLLQPKVWVAAGTQVFYTFGIGFGSIITLGSYNKFNHKFFRDSLVLCIINPATSIFSGAVIFSVLGHMAYVKDVEVADVVKSGPGLAFLVYPEAVLQLPLAPLWSIMFFIMLLVLGIDSQFCTVEALITGIVDEWASVLRPRRKLFTICVVIFLFLMGLPMMTEGGMYVFQLMDYYSASGMTLLFTVFFQTITIAWVYGVKIFSENIRTMVGFSPNWYFIVCWLFVAPAVCVAILLFSALRYQPLTYASTYTYPWWGEFMGWGMAMASMLWIPGYFVYFILTTPGTLKQRFRAGITPRISPKAIHDNIETIGELTQEGAYSVPIKYSEHNKL